MKRNSDEYEPVFFQAVTDKAAYERFVSKHGKVISYPKFIEMKPPRNIRELPHYYCICPMCRERRSLEAEKQSHLSVIHQHCRQCPRNESCPRHRQMGKKTEARLLEVEKKLRELAEHKEVVEAQEQYCKSLIATAGPDVGVVIMDFAAKIGLPVKNETTQQEFFDTKYVFKFVVRNEIILLQHDGLLGACSTVSQGRRGSAPLL